MIKVVSANVTFCTNKISNPNALQISWNKDKFTRSIFVYSDSGKDIIDWYTAIRAAKLRHLRIAFPEVAVNELVACLSRDFLKEGYLWKTGPRPTDSYKRRWFIIDENRKLMYLEHPLVCCRFLGVVVIRTILTFAIVRMLMPRAKSSLATPTKGTRWPWASVRA